MQSYDILKYTTTLSYSFAINKKSGCCNPVYMSIDSAAHISILYICISILLCRKLLYSMNNFFRYAIINNNLNLSYLFFNTMAIIMQWINVFTDLSVFCNKPIPSHSQCPESGRNQKHDMFSSNAGNQNTNNNVYTY